MNGHVSITKAFTPGTHNVRFVAHEEEEDHYWVDAAVPFDEAVLKATAEAGRKGVPIYLDGKLYKGAGS